MYSNTNASLVASLARDLQFSSVEDYPTPRRRLLGDFFASLAEGTDEPSAFAKVKKCWGTWNRTKILGFKGPCPTFRRSPNKRTVSPFIYWAYPSALRIVDRSFSLFSTSIHGYSYFSTSSFSL